MDSPSVGRASRSKGDSAIAVNAIKSHSLPQGMKGGLDPIAAALRLNRSGGGENGVGLYQGLVLKEKNSALANYLEIL